MLTDFSLTLLKKHIFNILVVLAYLMSVWKVPTYEGLLVDVFLIYVGSWSYTKGRSYVGSFIQIHSLKPEELLPIALKTKISDWI